MSVDELRKSIYDHCHELQKLSQEATDPRVRESYDRASCSLLVARCYLKSATAFAEGDIQRAEYQLRQAYKFQRERSDAMIVRKQGYKIIFNISQNTHLETIVDFDPTPEEVLEIFVDPWLTQEHRARILKGDYRQIEIDICARQA